MLICKLPRYDNAFGQKSAPRRGGCIGAVLMRRNGQHASVSLPADCLNALLEAIPRTPEQGLHAAAARAGQQVPKVDSWSLRSAAGRAGFVLTLRLPNGVVLAFEVRSWQLEAIASLVLPISERGSQN